LIVPNELANADTAFGSGTLANPAHRSQQVYGASEFGSVTGALLITELRFRPDYFYGRAFSATVSNIEINLSTTTRPAEGLSSTFADNIGSDDTTVFSGALSVSSQFTGPPNGPKVFDIRVPLRRPFLYNPAGGNLLLDIRNFSGSTASLLSGQGANDGASRVLGNINSSTGAPDNGADALQILFTLGTPPLSNSSPVARITVVRSAILSLHETNALVISVNNSNAVVRFDGSLSFDRDGDPLECHWFADGSIIPIATGVSASETFSIGIHSVTLVVDDGDLIGQSSQIFEVITLNDAVSLLTSILNQSGLPRTKIRPLLSNINAATRSFDLGNLFRGSNQLHAFQYKVRAQVTAANPRLAEQLILAAQAIIDAADAGGPDDG
jgi:hypothetical protein